ncbi:MAG: hypothetical protein WD645_02860 [Dehalococcoidia bacterium]
MGCLLITDGRIGPAMLQQGVLQYLPVIAVEPESQEKPGLVVVRAEHKQVIADLGWMNKGLAGARQITFH